MSTSDLNGIRGCLLYTSSYDLAVWHFLCMWPASDGTLLNIYIYVQNVKIKGYWVTFRSAQTVKCSPPWRRKRDAYSDTCLLTGYTCVCVCVCVRARARVYLCINLIQFYKTTNINIADSVLDKYIAIFKCHLCFWKILISQQRVGIAHTRTHNRAL